MVFVYPKLYSTMCQPLATWQSGADINQHTFTVTGLQMFLRCCKKFIFWLFHIIFSSKCLFNDCCGLYSMFCL